MRRVDLLAVVGLWLLATVYLWPVVGGGESLAGSDLVDNYLPYRIAAQESFAIRDFSFWNPYLFCGSPMAGNLNAALFYPPNWLSFAEVNLSRWFSLTVWVHVLWGLLGCYVFQRRVGMGAVASAVGAVTFWASGFFIFNLHSGIILFHQSAAWWPWTMLGAYHLAKSGGSRGLPLLSVSLAMMFLAGSPQVAFYAGITVGVMVIALLPGNTRKRPALFALLGAAVITFLLVQIQFQPAHQFGSLSQRATWDGEEAWQHMTGDSMSLRCLVLAVMPNLCGDPRDPTEFWGLLQGHHEVVPAVLVPMLILALLGGGLLAWRGAQQSHRRWLWIHVGLGLFALLASFGQHSPLFRLLWLAVPGFSEFRVPARLNVITLWSLSCVAALAVNQLVSDLKDGVQRPWRIGGWVVTGLGVLLLAVSTVADTHSLLLALGQPGGTRSDLGRHLYGHPELIALAKSEMLRFSFAVLLTGLGLLLVTWNRPRWIGVGCLATAMVWSLIPNSQINSVPTDEFQALLYPEKPIISTLKENLGAGRLLRHESVLIQTDLHPELLANRPHVLGIPTVRGYDPMIRDDQAAWMNVLTGLHPDTYARGSFYFDQIVSPALLRPLQVAVIATFVPMQSDVLELIAEDETGLLLYKMKEEPTGGHLYHRTALSTGDPMLDLWLLAGNDLEQFDPETTVLVEDEEALFVDPDPVGDEVESVGTGYSNMRFGVHVDGRAMLVTGIPYTQDLKVFDSSSDHEVFRVNLVWTGVLLPLESNTVTIFHQFNLVPEGFLLSLLGWLLIGLLLVRRQKKKGGLRRGPHERDSVSDSLSV